MNLVRLIYVSRFAKEVTFNDLQAIIDVSRTNNPKLNVTGVLCYGPGLFLQCLEGPRHAVNDLYHRIVNDARNQNVTLLDYAEIDERVFEEWAMAYVRADDLTEGLILKYSAGRQFDPYAMTSRQALGFVKGLLEEKRAFHAGA